MTNLYHWSDYLQLFKLARGRLISPENYYRFEKFQGELLVRYLKHFSIELQGKLLLDLGCGQGGFLVAFKEAGARITGLDLNVTTMFEDGLPKVGADALHVPFESSCYDVVVCTNLIEHLPEPELLLEEALRVLKPGGMLYLSFPPFYSPNGGHNFSPFHLLGERVAVWIFNQRHRRVNSNWTDEPYDIKIDSYERAFGDWGLYPFTIKKARRLISSQQVAILDQSVKYLSVNLSKTPIVNEFLSWHVQFLVQKNH